MTSEKMSECGRLSDRGRHLQGVLFRGWDGEGVSEGGRGGIVARAPRYAAYCTPLNRA
jgi:hypothetical protein